MILHMNFEHGNTLTLTLKERMLLMKNIFKQEGNADTALKPDFYVFLLTFSTQMNIS